VSSMLGAVFCLHGPESGLNVRPRPISLIAIGAVLLVAGFSASANGSDRSNLTIEQEEAERVLAPSESMVVYGRARQQLVGSASCLKSCPA